MTMTAYALKSTKHDTIWHRIRTLFTTASSNQGTASLPPSDRMARDIGLCAHELERLRLRLPSQTTRHPML